MAPDSEARPGRPARPAAYDPAYCDRIVEFCREGYSITGFAGSIGVARATIRDWADAHPAFAAAVKSAKAAAALWWEQRGREVCETGGRPGAATMIMFNLKNLAPEDYADRQSLEHSGPEGGPVETRDVSARELVASRIAGLAARAHPDRDPGGAD
jgi:hypothetical protein